MFKEHLMGLNLDPKIKEQFDKIEPGTKANFTRQYNKLHQAITKKTGGKGKKQTKADDSSDEGGSEEEMVMLDEEEMNEIKKAKALEKAQKKANNAKKRLDKFTSIRLIEG